MYSFLLFFSLHFFLTFSYHLFILNPYNLPIFDRTLLVGNFLLILLVILLDGFRFLNTLFHHQPFRPWKLFSTKGKDKLVNFLLDIVVGFFHFLTLLVYSHSNFAPFFLQICINSLKCRMLLR